MADTTRKTNLAFGVENNTKAPLNEIKGDVRAVGAEAAKAGQQAGAAFDGMGKSADGAATKFSRSEASLNAALRRYVEQAEIAVRTSGNLADAMEIKAEFRGFDVSKFEPMLDRLRDLQQQLGLAKAAEAELAAQNVFAAKARQASELAKASEYAAWWARELDKTEAEEKEFVAQNVFAAKARQAAELVKAGEYTSWWAQELEKAEAAERKLAGQNAFINSLKAQADAIGKTRADLLEMQAAQMGVSTQAAPFIAKLRESENAVGRVGMSASATAAAMRSVPAQFTDIVVSLQSGQAPMTVLLQQGGQLKDMFGGVGNAAKALGSYVLGLVSPLTLAAAAVAAVGIAYYQGAQESKAFDVALISTGNSAGVTRGQLQEYARQIASNTGTVGSASAALTAMVQAHAAEGAALRQYTEAAMVWEKATGQAVETVAKNFSDLANDPLKATLKLNEQYNYLTLAVYEQIKALEEQGKKTEAVKLAQDEYAKFLKSSADQIKSNLGYIESAWDKLSSTAKKAWDMMMGAGREAALQDKIGGLRDDIAAMEKQLAEGKGFSNNGGGAATGARASQLTANDIAQLKERIELRRQEVKALEDQEAAARKSAAADAARGARVQARAKWDADGIKFLSKSAQMERELAQARGEATEAGASAAELEQRLAGIREKHAEKGKSGTKAANAELEKQRSLIAELSGLSTTFYKDWERLNAMYAKGKLSMAELTVEQQKLLAQQPFMKQAAKEEAETLKARVKLYEDDIKAQEKLLEQRKKSAESVEEALRKAREEEEAYRMAAAMGITQAEALARLALARAEDNYQKALSVGADAQTLLALQREMEARRELIGVMQQRGVREANANAAKELTKEWDKVPETVSRTLADYIMSGGKNVAQYLKRLFSTLVLNPIVNAVVGSVLGMPGMASAGQSGGGLGVPGMGGFNMGWLTDFGSTLGDTIMNMGVSVANNINATAGNWLMDFGQSVGNASGAINMFGDGLGYLNSIIQVGKGNWGAGIGSAIGNWFGGPIGATIGNFLGGALDRIFGTKGANHVGGVYSSSGSIGRNDAAGRLTSGLGWKDPYDDLTRRGNQAIDESLGELVNNVLGWYDRVRQVARSGAPELDVVAGYATNPKYKNESNYGYYQIIDKTSGQIRSAYQNRELGSDGEAAFKQFAADLTKDMLDQLKGADIPAWMRSQLDGLGKTPTLDAINAAVTEILKCDAAFKLWNKTLTGFAGLTDTAQKALLDAAGGIDNLSSVVGGYYTAMYSQEEQLANKRKLVMEALADLGLDIDPAMGDAASAAYRKAVEDALAAGNTELAYKLMQLAPAFREVADASVIAGDAVESYSQTLKTMQEDRAKLEAELLQAQGDEAGYRAAMRAIETQGYSEAELAAYDYNQALREQIDATKAAADAARAAAQERYNLETRLLTLNGDTAALRERELAALDPSNRALLLDIYAREDAAAAARELEDAQRQQADAARAAAQAAEQHAQAIANERASLENRYLTLIGDTATLRQRELEALDPSNRALQLQIWAIEDAQEAQQKYTDALNKAQSAYDSAMSKVQAAQSTIDSIRAQGTQNYLSAVEAYNAAQQRVVDIQRQAAQKLRDLGNDMLDWIKGTTADAGYDPYQQQALAAAEYQRLLTAARAGDQEAMGKMTGAADKYLQAAEAVNSGFDFAAIRGQVLREVQLLAAGLANTALPGGNQPSELDTALAAVQAALSAMSTARDVALAIGAPELVRNFVCEA